MEINLQQPKISQLDQLLIDVGFAARQKFGKTPFRVWYVMLNEKAWKGIVINTASKIKLAEGPVRSTLNGSLASFKAQLEKSPTKTLNSGS